MPIGPARMPIMDHLGELRMRLVRIVVVLFIAICVFYLATPTIGQFLLLPIADCIPTGADGMSELYALTPFESFGTRFKIALWASIVACMPIILWQILAFFLPALKPKERKWFIPTFAAAVALFIIGTVFCYLIILHPAFMWLTDQSNGLGVVLPQMSSYISMIIKFELGFGFAFELPLIVFYLVIFGIVPYKKLRGRWREVYVALMVISAMITPDANPVTMLLMFAAMVGLYELSLLISRVVLRKRIAQKEAEEAADAAERAELVASMKSAASSAADTAVSVGEAGVKKAKVVVKKGQAFAENPDEARAAVRNLADAAYDKASPVLDVAAAAADKGVGVARDVVLTGAALVEGTADDMIGHREARHEAEAAKAAAAEADADSAPAEDGEAGTGADEVTENAGQGE